MKYNIDEVIGMAWSDKISFEEIKKKTGLVEKEVISIMRKNLKKKVMLFGEEEYVDVFQNIKKKLDIN